MLSIHVQFINPRVFKLSFMKQANVFGKGKGEEGGVSLKKKPRRTKTEVIENYPLPFLSFYSNSRCTYAQTALVSIVKVNKRDFVLEMRQYLT